MNLLLALAKRKEKEATSVAIKLARCLTAQEVSSSIEKRVPLISETIGSGLVQ